MINFNEANFEKSIGSLGQLSEENIPEIVFSGKSNVGKSSLINKILNRKSLARTSSKPGKTININFYKLRDVRFVDLPGYGYAQVSFKEKKRWSELVEGYFKKERNIKLIIQIIDFRHPPSVLDMQMIEFLSSQNFPFVIVASKSDKLNKTNREMREKMIGEELHSYKDIPKIIFSSQTGEGIEKIKSIISDYCEK
ncbi:MAG: ribosome biogenesis GTP-binding protein YihA/YsxC [Acutalibacteraceae bacterium]